MPAKRGGTPTPPIFQDVLATAQQFLQGTRERQSLIENIEKLTGRRLLVYHASIQHQAGIMTGADLNLVMDLCDDLGPRRVPADLLIHTSGGDANTAELILNTLHQRASSVRVIVPRAAKSAGTLVAMGAEEIVMGAASELGPVDPQFPVIVGGIPRYLPAQAIVDSYDELVRLLHEAQALNQPGGAYATALQHLDPAFVNEARRQIDHSKAMGQRWLVRAMYPGDTAKAKGIMDRLSDANIHKSHGRMIDAKMARDEIGLRVKILPARNRLWRALWRLHLLNEFYIGQLQPGPAGTNIARVKLFESRKVSLVQQAAVS
jgi:hypothetical protein